MKPSAVLKLASSLGAEPGVVRASKTGLMLARPYARAFSQPDWCFEIKYDGFRLRAAKERGRARLFYRRGSEVTERFPAIARAIAALPFDDLLLDGELVAFDEYGLPDFERMQRFARGSDEHQPGLRFIAFDLLSIGEHDVRRLRFVDRRRLLDAVVPEDAILGRALQVIGEGQALFEQVKKLGLEGMVAKKADSTYVDDRSDSWRKICVRQEAQFLLVGLSHDLSVVHVADEGLRYAGTVELGIPVRALEATQAQWRLLQQRAPACSGAPKGKGHIWLRPTLTCRVRFKQRTRSGRLRDPLLIGIAAA